MKKLLLILTTILVSTWSCKKENNSLPSLSTQSIDSITSSTASSGGTILDEGGTPVTQRGVVWSTSQGPTITDNSSSDGAGSGSFVSNLTGLLESTTYYVRAYATNSHGTSYGNELSFTTVQVPTLSDRLEGIWQLNDITMSGNLDIGNGMGSSPVIGNDQSITSTSAFILTQQPNIVNFNIDAQIDLIFGALIIPYPWQQTGSGTWLAKSGGNSVPDSLIITANDGSLARYEILNLLESEMSLRTTTVLSSPASGTLATELSFVKQ
jgi:hypothetical protein